VVLDTSGSIDRMLLAKALGAIASYSLSRDVWAVRVVFCCHFAPRPSCSGSDRPRELLLWSDIVELASKASGQVVGGHYSDKGLSSALRPARNSTSLL
jgi:hypothetical protein